MQVGVGDMEKRSWFELLLHVSMFASYMHLCQPLRLSLPCHTIATRPAASLAFAAVVVVAVAVDDDVAAVSECGYA